MPILDINAQEYKSQVGLDMIHVAKVLKDDLTGYQAETPQYFAPAINAVVEPTTSQDTQYADNVPFDVLPAEGESKITFDTTNIPIPMLAYVLGKEFEIATGRFIDTGSDAAPPDFAVSFRSMKSNGAQRYFQYLKGKFSVPKDEASTVTDKKEPKPSQIIFTAVNTMFKFDRGSGIFKSVKRIMGDEDTLNFSGTNWFTAVQVPGITTPPVFSLSSSVPVDGASAVDVSADLTLTFSNAVKAEALNGVMLFSVTDGLVVPSVVSQDATKKILTVNPNASLLAATSYLLVYSVSDIYNQSLNGAINFTTA